MVELGASSSIIDRLSIFGSETDIADVALSKGGASTAAAGFPKAPDEDPKALEDPKAPDDDPKAPGEAAAAAPNPNPWPGFENALNAVWPNADNPAPAGVDGLSPTAPELKLECPKAGWPKEGLPKADDAPKLDVDPKLDDGDDPKLLCPKAEVACVNAEGVGMAAAGLGVVCGDMDGAGFDWSEVIAMSCVVSSVFGGAATPMSSPPVDIPEYELEWAMYHA